jgi:AcrR family transcriptional regulator
VPESSRIARRRTAQRDRILAVAAHGFACKGIDGVRLDQIAEDADIARGTLYSHFATKEELIDAIIRPALEFAVAQIKQVTEQSARGRIDAILSLYISLWRNHRDALRVSYHMQGIPKGRLLQLHHEFSRSILAALANAAEEKILRVQDPMLAARMIMRVAVPLLELYADRGDTEHLFVDSMRGLLLVD